MKDSFLAISPDETLKFYIYREPDDRKNLTIRGWCFIVERVLAGGTIEPVWDTWERTFTEIARYPRSYERADMAWRGEDDGSIYSLPDLGRRYRFA